MYYFHVDLVYQKLHKYQILLIRYKTNSRRNADHQVFPVNSQFSKQRAMNAFQMRTKYFTASSVRSSYVANVFNQMIPKINTQVTVKVYQEILKRFHCMWLKVSPANWMTSGF